MLPGLLRIGAVLCGPPAWDESNCTAEFLVLLDTRSADRRYLPRFLGSDPQMTHSLGFGGDRP